MTEGQIETSANYERLVGAVILGLNELEMNLAYLMICFYGDYTVGNATAGPIGFKDKVKILGSLNAAGPLPQERKEKLAKQLVEATRLADARNRVAHAELFSFDYEDDDGHERSGYQLQKFIRDKRGQHSITVLPDSTADLQKIVDDARRLTAEIWEQSSYYETHIHQVFPTVCTDETP